MARIAFTPSSRSRTVSRVSLKSWAVMVSWMVVVIAGVPSCRLVVGALVIEVG